MSKLKLNVDQVLKKYALSDLTRAEVVKILILILDNSDNEKERIASLKALGDVETCSSKCFELLERLMVSDLDEKIRSLAVFLMGQKFLNRAFQLLKWMLKYEKSYITLVATIKVLEKVATEDSKQLILDKISRIIKIHKKSFLNHYVSMIKELDNKIGLSNLTQTQLSSILINLMTISNLSNLYPNFGYKICKQSLTVYELDLSDLELEPKGLPFGWINNIKNISDIEGLTNLKDLKYLDLSNNKIENVKDIVNLENLEYLNLSNNKIKDINEMKFINQLAKLRTLDLHGNQIVNDLSPKDVKFSLKVISKTYFEEAEEVYEKYFIKN